MFPPSSSEKPFSNPNQNFSKQLCTNHENPSATQEDLPSFFFPFSSHFTESRNSLQNQLVPQTDQKSLKTRKKKRCDIDKNINSKPNPRKRTRKSDRHSKIYTAHGLRDRRMRLSVQIARKFFDLQDMLGFDKASKTIEWLFSKSSAAIRDLTVNLPQMNTNGSSISISNCEVDPEMEDKNNGYNSYAKEKRYQARARARERTKKLKEPCGSLEENPRNLGDLGFLRPFETKDGKVIPLQDVGMLESFLGTTSSSASNSAAFDFWKDPSILGGVDSSNSLMEIFGNSDVTHMIDSYDRLHYKETICRPL